MNQLAGYHRPSSVADAVELLGSPHRVALAGGTTIIHDGGGSPVEVVDLQALGLDDIAVDGDRVRLGATATLQSLVDSDIVPDLLRGCARADQPSTLRTLATVGGTIGAADRESRLLAALLVHDAVVRFADDRSAPIGEVLATGLAAGALIVGVTVVAGGATAIASTGRTPGDSPIVAALARRADDGVRVAVCGVAPAPVLVDPAELERLEPAGDFRGSAAYRRHLAQVLTARVIGELS